MVSDYCFGLTHSIVFFFTYIHINCTSLIVRFIVGEVALDGLLDPVLVIGAGLSAADAIMAARFRGIPVLHIFRDSSNDWNKESNDKIKTNTFDKLQWLPSSIYPEYHKVYEMMADGGTNYPLYKSLPGYTLVDLNINNDDCNSNQRNKHTVTLCTPNGQLKNFRVSVVAILIGKLRFYIDYITHVWVSGSNIYLNKRTKRGIGYLHSICDLLY